MNREHFNHIYQNELTPKQKKVLLLFLVGQSDEEIAWEIGATHRSTTSHQLRNISKKFGFPPESEPDYRCNLIELFAKYNSSLVSSKALEKCGYNTHVIRFPEGAEPLKSPFYIKRSFVEDNCFQAIQQTGILIRIKAAKQMGKTSLLKRIIAEAKALKYHTVYLNFSLMENEQLRGKNSFLVSFSTYLAHQLSQTVLGELPQDMINCTAYFKKVLKQSQTIFVLALDEVDRLFEYPEIYQNFFPMLRNWNENASESEVWENLRLVIAHSTENYGKLDINQSPSNIGLPIKLDEFNEEQVRNLAIKHGLDSQNTTTALMSLVGGHPYLVRLAFYYLAVQEQKIEQILKTATTDTGIYNQHLRRHLETFINNEELATVFKQILHSDKPVKLECKTQQVYQLESMGLIKILDNFVTVRCLLYQKYYQERLI